MTSTRPAITVGIPFYNPGRHFDLAIRSVFAQSVADWELILVDDGSDDGSLEVARSIDDPRVRVISDGVRAGTGPRLNQVASLARGAFLARMDADDVMHPDRLRLQVSHLESQPGLDFVASAVWVIGDTDEVRGVRPLRYPPPPGPKDMLRGRIPIHPSVMGRREWFQANQYSHGHDRAEDFELWVRTAATSRWSFMSVPLLFYRESVRGLVTKYLATQRSVRRVLAEYGPPLIGQVRTRALIARSLAKSAVYSVAVKVGAERVLVRRRAAPVEEDAKRQAAEVLASVTRCAVPGLVSRGAN